MNLDTTGLANLYVKYYVFVKKQRDIHFEKHFLPEELHEIQYTLLLFLNHLGTDENNEALMDPTAVESNINQANNTQEPDESLCKVTEVTSEPTKEESINEIIVS